MNIYALVPGISSPEMYPPPPDRLTVVISVLYCSAGTKPFSFYGWVMAELSER